MELRKWQHKKWHEVHDYNHHSYDFVILMMGGLVLNHQNNYEGKTSLGTPGALALHQTLAKSKIAKMADWV